MMVKSILSLSLCESNDETIRLVNAIVSSDAENKKIYGWGVSQIHDREGGREREK